MQSYNVTYRTNFLFEFLTYLGIGFTLILDFAEELEIIVKATLGNGRAGNSFLDRTIRLMGMGTGPKFAVLTAFRNLWETICQSLRLLDFIV